MHLICHMPESAEKQKLPAEEIQKDLKAVKDCSEQRRRAIRNDIHGGTETEQFEKRLRADTEYAELPEDAETRSRLQDEAMRIRGNLPFPIMVPKYR